MGVSCAPDIFQDKIYSLMKGLEFIQYYLDDLLILSNELCDDHLSKVEMTLQRLHKTGLRVRAKKCKFARPELEYLGYLITREGVKPMPKKTKAMLEIKEPKMIKQLQSFLGLVN